MIAKSFWCQQLTQLAAVEPRVALRRSGTPTKTKSECILTLLYFAQFAFSP